MASYFEVKCRCTRMLENGAIKKVNESYIVDAMSFAEAESRALKNVTPGADGDIEIRTVRRTPIAELIAYEGEKFFLAKIAFITLDEKSGLEKKTATQMLVGGADYDSAKENFEKAMEGTVSDYELQSLSETGIAEIFLY